MLTSTHLSGWTLCRSSLVEASIIGLVKGVLLEQKIDLISWPSISGYWFLKELIDRGLYEQHLLLKPAF